MANIKLVFSIYGDHFNPLDLNTLTRVDDSVYWHKGDALKNKSILRKETAWEYTIEGSNILHFSNIEDEFINKFLEYKYIIKQYLIDNNLKAKIDIVVEIVNRISPSMYFGKKLIDFISSIECEIDIDIYILD